MGNVMPERPVAWACERRPYTAEELIAIRDKVHKSLNWVNLSEECPTEIIRSYAVSIDIPSVLQSTLDNDNPQFMSSSDEDDAELQGGVNANIIRQPIGPPAIVEVQRLSGFSRFVRDHISPIHRRVTAGGRVVPAGPVTPPVTFTKPFLEEFIKVTDRVLQKNQRAQVVESDTIGVGGDLMALQQNRRMNGSTDLAPAYLRHTVHGNPLGVRNPVGPESSDENRRSTPQEQAINAANELFHQLPGSQIVTVRPDGAIFVFHNGLLYRQSKMEGGRTRYDSVFYKDGQLTFGLGPGIVFENAQAPHHTVGNASASAADGQTQSVNGQQAVNPMLVLPPGAQLQNILANGMVIFSHDGKAKSAKLLGDKTVYGNVDVPAPDLDLTQAQVHLPIQMTGAMQAMPPMEAMTMMGPIPTMPNAGFVAPEYMYPAPGFDPGFNRAQPVAANDLLIPHSAFPVSIEEHTAYHDQMQVLNMQLANTQSELNVLDREWAQYGDERDDHGSQEYGRLRGIVVNTIADIRQAIKRMESARPARIAFRNGGGPSNSGRISQPQPKKKLSPDAPIFVPGSSGFAGPSSTPIMHGGSSAHLRNDSTQSWTPEMEQQGIFPSVMSVLATSGPSREGKKKAIEHSHKEIRTEEPVSVFSASDNEVDKGSALSVEAKEGNLSDRKSRGVLPPRPDASAVPLYDHNFEDDKKWPIPHFDDSEEAEERLAARRKEHHAKYGGYYVPRPTRREMLEHLHEEKEMADWVPFPDETLVEFFKAYTKYKRVFQKVKQSIKPESLIVFPGFYIPPEWLAQLKTPSQEDQTLDESPTAAATLQGEVKQVEEKQSKATVETGEASNSSANRRDTAETSKRTAAYDKESVSHGQRTSISRPPGNELADVTNSARVVDNRRPSNEHASSSGQTVAPQTGESSTKPRGTQVTPEEVALMKSIIAEKIDEKLQREEVQAFIDKITEAKVEDANVRNAKIIERNVITQQLVIDREAHAKLEQTKKALAQTEKELAEHKRLIKEQERELQRYYNSPHRHESTPQHCANPTHERHGPNQTRPTLPMFGESGCSYSVERPQLGPPNRPDFDQGSQGQNRRTDAQSGNGVGTSSMRTPTHHRTGRQLGTPGRQQMLPPQMSRMQITPPHMAPPQTGRTQITPPHMGPWQMGQMQIPPSHMGPPMSFEDACFSGPGNYGMGNPMMEQQMMQPMRQPRGPPQMGPEQMQIMGPPQMMGLPQMMGPGQMMGLPPMMGLPTMMPPSNMMGPPQMMGPQHMVPPNMTGPPNMAPPQMTGPPNMGQGQMMGPPRMMEQAQAMNPLPMMGPLQMMPPPNMGPAQGTRPRQVDHARITSQDARFIEQGNLFNDHGIYENGVDDFDNHHIAPPTSSPLRAFPPFETPGIRMMDQRNHNFGNQQMGPPMGPPHLGPSPFDNDVRGMDHGNQGFGDPEMGGPPAWSGQMGNPIVCPAHFENQAPRSIGRSRGRKHGNDARTTSPLMGPPNDDPSFLETEDLRPVGHNRNHHNAFGPAPAPVAPQLNLPQTSDRMQHALNAPAEKGPGYMTTHSPETTRSSGRRGPGFASHSQAEPRYSTSPEDTPLSRRGARRFGADQMMSSRYSPSPEDMRSSQRGANRFIGNGQAAADLSSGSQEETSPLGRRQENFDQRNMSPLSARAARSSRSPEHTPSSHGLGSARAGNVSTSQVASEDRPHGRQLFPNFGPIGTRLPPPDFKFPEPAAQKFPTHPRPSGHPGRRSITDDHFSPFLPGRDLF